MHPSKTHRSPTAFCALIITGWLAAPAVALDYKRDIMPIFEKKCFDCHSSGEKVKGGLRLDDPKNFYNRFAKNDVVIPGDWDASFLFVAVSRARNAKGAMPPKGKGDPLTPEEIMKVANWIYEGARIDGERGERGAKDDKPEDFIKFKDGVMVTEEYLAESQKKPEEKPAEKMREWRNAEGKKMMAIFKGIEGDKVIFVREDGKTFKYPIEKLSDTSQAELKKLKAEAGTVPEKR